MKSCLHVNVGKPSCLPEILKSLKFPYLCPDRSTLWRCPRVQRSVQPRAPVVRPKAPGLDILRPFKCLPTCFQPAELLLFCSTRRLHGHDQTFSYDLLFVIYILHHVKVNTFSIHFSITFVILPFPPPHHHHHPAAADPHVHSPAMHYEAYDYSVVACVSCVYDDDFLVD